MANTQIDITRNGTTTLATAGKYCDRNIDVNVFVQQTGGITPTGSITITENGTYDVWDYASAIVDVADSGGGSSYWDAATVRAMLDDPTNLSGTALENLVIPEGVTLIREYCFRQLFIETVVCPNSLSGIGQYAFAYCSSLTNVTFNEGLRNIYRSAFDGCYNIQELNFPSTLRSLSDYCFNGCTDLTTVRFKGTPIGTIESDAFNGCTNLTDIYVPWSEGQIANAPWGATNATIHYNSTV